MNTKVLNHKYHGGEPSDSFIKNIRNLIVGRNYKIHFYDVGDSADWVEDEIAPNYDGTYTMKEVKILPAYSDEEEDYQPFEPLEYAIFKRSDGIVLHLSENGPDNCRGIECYFSAPFSYNTAVEYRSEHDYVDNYEDAIYLYCTIQLDTPSSPVEFNIDTTCFDIIEGTDVSIVNALRENNIVFAFYEDNVNSAVKVAIPSSQFKNSYANKDSYTIYECLHP